MLATATVGADRSVLPVGTPPLAHGKPVCHNGHDYLSFTGLDLGTITSATKLSLPMNMFESGDTSVALAILRVVSTSLSAMGMENTRKSHPLHIKKFDR